ncbi:MAG: hypothetical protein ACP5P9_09410 [Acidimicrobiales bacterium]
MAAVTAALALSGRGPLGVVRVVPPTVHVTLVLAVAVLAAASPVVPVFRPGVAGIVLVELAALGLGRGALLTRTSNPVRASSVAAPTDDAADSPLEAASRSDGAATSDGRTPAASTSREPPEATASLARRTGRVLARIERATRSTTDAARRAAPAAEAGVGAAARAAGRGLARRRARGGALSPSPEPGPPPTTGA